MVYVTMLSGWNRLQSVNACYHSVQNLLSSSFLFKNIKNVIYRTIILPVVFVWVWSLVLTLREIRSLKVFENRVLRKTFGPKRDNVRGEWRRLHKK
jgi:hypothetical protein